MLSDDGRKVWICGSMNVNYKKPLNGWFLLDPWTTKCSRAELEPYFNFVQANVTEYATNKVPISRKDQLDFVWSMGASFDTPIAKQFASEQVSEHRWKRAVILDRLQMDLFKWYFKIKLSPEDQAEYQHAILFGYEQMDRLLGEFMTLARKETTLAFATAFSQQPCQTWEDRGGKIAYRPNNFQEFLPSVEINASAKVSPVMTQQFNIDFEPEDLACVAQAKLLALRYGDVAAMSAHMQAPPLAKSFARKAAAA